MQMHDVMALFERETKPATEFVRGRMLQKMSARYAHARLQGRWFAILDEWSEGGAVGAEWRFYFAPHDGDWGSLVPDVSYVRGDRVRAISPEELERPTFAPDVAVEILSPDDRRADLDWKIAAYLHGGTSLVVVVDSRARTVEAHDASGRRVFGEAECFAHPAVPGLEVELAKLFDGVYRG